MGWQMPTSTVPPSPPQDAAGATNRVSNMGGTLVDDATAAEVLKRLQVDGTRSRLAQAIFPYNDNYKRVSEWKKAVGGIVASDIRNNAWLRHQMHLLGYQERKVGYSYAQQLLLVKFYVQQGVLDTGK